MAAWLIFNDQVFYQGASLRAFLISTLVIWNFLAEKYVRMSCFELEKKRTIKKLVKLVFE